MMTTSTPYFVPADFQESFANPCALYPNGRDWYKGTGIAPDQHPLSHDIPFGPCDGCQSNDVLVIAAQWNLHPYSGDVYWDYEIECQTCRQYSQHSYSEN